MIYNLQAHLATMPYKDLRGLATRLGLRQRAQVRKAEWLVAITAGWQQATHQQVWLHNLSVAATNALIRLLRAGKVPAALFWAEYGPIRHATAKQHWSPPPWQAPACVSEELYYSGLLVPADAPSLARAQWVTLPTDLRPILTAHFLSGLLDPSDQFTEIPALSSLPGSPEPAAAPAWPLCHDVGQWLIFLHSHPGLPLQHGRWLTLPHLAALNERLWHPIASKPLPSHRRNPYLCLLSFLAEVGELQTQGQLTPKAWAWLASAPQAQLAWLWQAWCIATPPQRQRYALPTATVGAPWPQPLLRQLQLMATHPPFTAANLVNRLWHNASPNAAFWAANFQDLHDLDQVVAQTLAAMLLPFGIVTTDPARPDVYQVTATGARLLAQPSSAQPILAPAMSLDGPGFVIRDSAWGYIDTGDTATYWLDLSALPSPTTLPAQAQLAHYGAYTAPPIRSPQAYHRYQLTATTLAQAAAAGYGLPNLLAALAQCGLTPTPALHVQLSAWHAQGRQLTLTQAPLLRTTTPEQLAAIAQIHTLQPALGEILAPTVAVITTDLPAFAEQLQRQGYYASIPLARQATPSETSSENAAALGVLWLAGRIYAHLGDHLALPLPPPSADLDRLLASLPITQQAVLQAQAEHLHQQLLNLLDNLPFTPPPHPSDPSQWRPLLAQAIAAGQRVQISYFSAGRNLTTRRLLEPYWIEEHRTIPYLRAYCHSAGRVLTFRLDRIAELEAVN